MRIDIISVVPELMTSAFSHSILKRAAAKGLVEVNLINLREYATDKHRMVAQRALENHALMRNADA